MDKRSLDSFLQGCTVFREEKFAYQYWVPPENFDGRKSPVRIILLIWETDFYTPQVMEGAAFFTIQQKWCIKFGVGTEFLYTTAAELSKRATPPSSGGV